MSECVRFRGFKHLLKHCGSLEGPSTAKQNNQLFQFANETRGKEINRGEEKELKTPFFLLRKRVKVILKNT